VTASPVSHLLLTAVALAVAIPAAAQTSTASTSATPTGDSPQQVTIQASPILEQNRSDAFGSLVSEVGSTQLRDLNAIDLSGALRRMPGVQVSRFNPVGAFGGDEGGAVYVRGLGASRPGSEVKTLVDGLPFYMGVWNHALLDLLPVQAMERISVLKGPQPQTVGNTFAAIDLSPRVARRDGLSGHFQVAGGSFGTVVQQADLAGRFGDAEFSIAQGHAESDGHRPQASGRLDNGLVRGSIGLGAHWRVAAMLLAADNRVSDPGEEGLPATRRGHYDSNGTLAALSLAHEHGGSRGRIQLYDNRGTGVWDDTSTTPGTATRSEFRLSGLRWRETLSPWQDGELVAGLDIDRMDGSVAFNGYTAFDAAANGASMRLTAPYAAVAQRLALSGGWQLTPSAGVRLYRHNVYGSQSAPHVGMVLEQGDTLSLRANAARGLNFPGLDAALLNTLVPPLAGSSPQGWRALRPERMDHVELGARWQPARGSAMDLALFHDRLSDRYVFAFPPAVALPSFTNLGDYSVRGLESTWQQTWGAGFSSFAGVTLLDPSLADLPYAPKRAASLGLVWQQGPWRISADGQAQDGMFTLNKGRSADAVNTERVGGFALLNLRGALALPALGRDGEVFLTVENAGDRRYAYRPGYTMPGRSGQVGVRVGL
jgi:iron complex outermembrane receptor protein